MYGLLNHKILIIKGEKNVSLCKNEAYSGNFEKDFAPIAKVIRMNSYARSALAVAQRRLVSLIVGFTIGTYVLPLFANIL